MSRMDKSIEIADQWLPRAGGGVGMEEVTIKGQVIYFEAMKVFQNLTSVAHLYEYTKNTGWYALNGGSFYSIGIIAQ